MNTFNVPYKINVTERRKSTHFTQKILFTLMHSLSVLLKIMIGSKILFTNMAFQRFNFQVNTGNVILKVLFHCEGLLAIVTVEQFRCVVNSNDVCFKGSLLTKCSAAKYTLMWLQFFMIHVCNDLIRLG